MDAPKNKGGRPVLEVPNKARLVRFPDELWERVTAAAGGSHSISRLLRVAVEKYLNDIEKNQENVSYPLDNVDKHGL